MPTTVTDVYDINEYNFIVHQGTTFKRTITYKDAAGAVITLGTGATAAMKVRKSYPATLRNAAYRDNAVISLTSSPAAGLTVTPSTGQVAINISAATMASVPAGIYDYDLEVTVGTGAGAGDSGDVIKLMSGLFEIKQEMTY